MGKSAKQQRRKEERERKRLEEEAQGRRDRRRRLMLAAIPLLTAAAATYSWFNVDHKAITGGIVLAGMMLWLFTGLGFLGGNIRPRDRIRAGSIDFGRKRK